MQRIKNTIATLQTHRHYDKAMYWGKAISITGIAQIIVQAVGFISGILVIRLLPVQEYALYTLANTMLGTMTVLADGGISTGVMAQGGKVWQDREKLGAVLATGLDLRRKFAIGSLIVSTPILLYLLLHNGASWLTAVLIVLSLIPAFYAALSDSLLEIVPKLHQSILPLQKNQVTVGIGRLLLTTLTLFVFPWTFVAILAGGIPRIYGNIKLRKITDGFVSKQAPNWNIRKEILSIVRKSMPMCIYFVLSSQISIWILSVFGKPSSIAQLGALSRLSVLFAFFTVMLSTLIIPRYSRLSTDKNKLLNIYISLLGVVLFLCFLILSLTYLFPKEILWVFGKDYSTLSYELFLNVSVSCIGLLAMVSSNLNLSRGWVLNSVYMIVADILNYIVCALVFDLTTLRGVLYCNIIAVTINFLLMFLYGLFSIQKINKQIL